VANTINVTYKVNEDGSLQKIAQSAGKAAAATDKATKSSDNYSKKQKGVAGATSNSTKAFSKMSSGIQGGLVPAYAEIAARVFALTALFGVLSRNDAVRKLQEGIEFTGRSAGRNLTFISRELQTITGNAISAADAMRATAVGVSAGFSETQLKGLASVAKSASLALGRDLGDSMDRLIRGAAKLEPEILDELGIMVRLDEASTNYARSLNKNVSELTNFEKRMAFTNAILEEGRQKFDGISDAMDTSPYSKLLASLQDLGQKGIGGLNKVLGPVAGFLAENTFALGALVALYAGSIAGTIIGGITAMSEASALGAKRTEAQSTAALKGIKPNKLLGKAFNETAESGDRSAAALTRMQKSLNMTINMTTKDTAKLKAAKKARNQLTSELYKADLAQVKLNFTNALSTLQEVGLMAGIRAHIQALTELKIKTIEATLAQTGFAKVLTVTRGVMVGVAASAKFLGAAFLTVMPYIGMVLAAIAILGPIITKIFGLEDTRLEKQIKKNKERFEEFNNVVEQYNKTIPQSKTATQLWLNTLKPISGLLTETAAAMRDTIAAADTQRLLEHVASVRALAAANKNVKAIDTTMTLSYRGGRSDIAAAKENAKELQKTVSEGNGELSEELKKMVEKDLITSMVSYTNAQGAMRAKLEELGKSGAPVADALAAVDEAGRGAADILKKMIADPNYSLTEAATAMQVLATSTTASVQAFESFNDIVNKAKDLAGDLTSTWGTYGKDIDNLQQGLLSVNKVLQDGKGVTAANEMAGSILKAYGIEPGKDPVAQLTELKAEMSSINSAYKNLNLREAQASLSNTSNLESAKTAASMIQERIDLKTREIQLAVEGGAVENDLFLERLQLMGSLRTEEKKALEARAERAKRLGGEQFGATFKAAEGYLDYSANEGIDAKTSEKMAKLQELGAPMIDQLKSLSPEGEFMGAAIQGALQLSEAFSMAFEDIAAKGNKMQIGLEVAAAGLNVISGMMAAQSKSQVAAVDAQIEAEKKRDGKSKESLAKIAALEKKKEAIKRKAFEQDKKLKMATVLISTASAVMKAVEESPSTFGMPFSAFAIAMGAAQLAAIAGTTYQGGGSASAGAAAPTSINVGNRQNSVDLAKARSPSGEQAYARGSAGTGRGMTDFTPAFTGTKYRASGGNTGFMVGEQGPEMFIPDRPGRITPADDVARMGAPMNVNFTIQAIDAQGIEQVLNSQRGNLIGMIREAANAHGEEFLENVNVQAYQGSAGGGRQYDGTSGLKSK
jgi:hypothetical protein